MINGKKIIVVMPAYNAAKTLKETLDEVPMDIVDDIVLVDDHSKDNTAEVARNLGINHIIVHEVNRGYGGNQKSCYNKALELGADIVIMVHPDYQFTPKLITAMCSIIGQGLYSVVFASRILGRGARKGGMPLIKYIANRCLTFFENLMLHQKLSEYHTGYRAYSAEVLRKINYEINSDDFIFDNQVIAQIFNAGYEIAEVTCPTKYFPEASSINLKRSAIYGLGVIKVSILYRLYKWKLCNPKIFRNA